jgi:transposase
VLYPVCGGMDVHRDTVVVSVLAMLPSGRRRRETSTFGTFTAELQNLVRWLDEREVPVVAMESTGVCWRPVYRVLKTASPQRTVWLVNPSQIKAVPGLARAFVATRSQTSDQPERRANRLVRQLRSLGYDVAFSPSATPT